MMVVIVSRATAKSFKIGFPIVAAVRIAQKATHIDERF
jgi:hypothetical protein